MSFHSQLCLLILNSDRPELPRKWPEYRAAAVLHSSLCYFLVSLVIFSGALQVWICMALIDTFKIHMVLSNGVLNKINLSNLSLFFLLFVVLIIMIMF